MSSEEIKELEGQDLIVVSTKIWKRKEIGDYLYLWRPKQPQGRHKKGSVTDLAQVE